MRAATAVESSRWAWLRAPCSLTQVCAVIDGTTPPEIVAALCERFGSAPQFCVLELRDAAALHAQWLASFSTQGTRGTSGAEAKRTPAEADQLLAALPPGSLLALCSQHVEQLDWLGSVTGHPCRLVAINATDATDATDTVDASTRTQAAVDAVGAVWMEALAAQLDGER